MMHWHEHLEILRFTAGRANIQLNTKTHSVKAGEIVIINASELHMISVDGNECVYDVLGVNYGFCRDWGFDLDQLLYKNIIDDPNISSLFDKISAEHNSKAPCFKAIVSGCVLELLALITRNHTAEKNENDPSLLKKLDLVRAMTLYISENYGSRQILADLSEELNYSQFYLSHTFKEMMNISVKGYQMQTRFIAAVKLLDSENRSVAEVAQHCGYQNASAFCAEFKKRFNMTPAQYRANQP